MRREEVNWKFWNYVLIGDGCWEWTGGRTKFGYGCMSLEDRGSFAHRVSYEFFVGPIPDKLQVLHKCDNPSCVRPDHLFTGTQKENLADAVRKGRLIHGINNIRKTHCYRGHLLSGENIRIYQGRRICRTCGRERMRRVRQGVTNG